MKPNGLRSPQHPGTLALPLAENASTVNVFRVHGIWGPGVRLMRNLNFAAKASLISGLFLVAVVLLGYFFTTSQLDQITFAKKERQGVESLTKFLPTYAAIQKTRNASQATLGGFDGAQRYQSARAEVDKSLESFEQHLAATGDPLKLSAQHQTLKTAWAATANAVNGGDDKGRSVFSPVFEAILELLAVMGDQSNLVLDPELDSFYLVDTMVLALPQLIDDVGQLWGWGTFALAHPGLSVDDEKRYLVWSVGVESGIRHTRSFLQRAMAANPALQQKLDLGVLSDVQKFLVLAKDPDVVVNQPDNTPENFYNRGEAMVARMFDFYATGLPALDGLLSQRISHMQNRLLSIAVVLSLALLLVAYFFMCFFKVTHGGLRLISLHLQEMARGDLRNMPGSPWGRDEPAYVILDLRKAYDSLLRLIQNVQRSSQALHVASDDIASASTNLSVRTEAAAASLERQASSMEQMGVTVNATAEQAKLAAKFAAENAEVARKGGHGFTRVTETMQGIHASSAKISDIIGVIDGIAFQTNILALNAAVEAARAGDAGRGFAVVASEVRELAQRSASAAHEIKDLISNSVRQVGVGRQVVEAAGQAMQVVISHATEVSTALSDISRSSDEQALGVTSVGHAIQVLDRHTKENVVLVEQTSSAASALREQADLLQEEVSNFLLR